MDLRLVWVAELRWYFREVFLFLFLFGDYKKNYIFAIIKVWLGIKRNRCMRNLIIISCFSSLMTSWVSAEPLSDTHGVDTRCVEESYSLRQKCCFNGYRLLVTKGCTTDDKGGYSLSNIPREADASCQRVLAIGYNTKVVRIFSSFIPDTLILDHKSYYVCIG